MSAAVIPWPGSTANQWAPSAASNRDKWRGRRRCGGRNGEGEKSLAGKLLPPVPSERKTGTNRAATVATEQRGLLTGGPIFVIIVTEDGHHSEEKTAQL